MRRYIYNFILISKNTTALWKNAKGLVDIRWNRNHAFFNSDKTYIAYKLKYVPPFDKDFVELKNLQIAAAKAASLSRKYHGYFLLDLTKYIGHETEDYFDITLKFLRDMAVDWAYVFIINKAQGETSAMLKKISSLFYDTSIKYINTDDMSEKEPAISWILGNLHVDCAPRIELALQRLIDNNLVSDEQAEIMIREIIQENNAITKHNILQYLDDLETTSFLKIILSHSAYIRALFLYKNGVSIAEKKLGLIYLMDLSQYTEDDEYILFKRTMIELMNEGSYVLDKDSAEAAVNSC